MLNYNNKCMSNSNNDNKLTIDTVLSGAEKYDHKGTEVKWQNKWQEVKLYETDLQTAKNPYYNLMMFPYPSAEGLHVGNMYAFTGSDIYGRFKKMQGYNVFEPIGLDGFGIHSENYALKIGRHPMDHANITQTNFYKQLNQIGAMFDWSRTVQTYDPKYYKWTQWLFIQMFKHGLAYRKSASVNFCPGCKTVLADEQVIDAKCERCGNNIEKRLLEQWFFKITAYAEKLLENIPALKWSEKVKTAQTNWIGKKIGINISYEVYNSQNIKIGDIVCFTTRPDTNFGASFIVLAPEHPFITQIMKVIDSQHCDRVIQYINSASKISDAERVSENKRKTGVDTTCYCINRLNNTKLPLYISDFVLMGFGTGAVVGVPGHDKRDFEFAQKFNLPVKRVVCLGDKIGPITTIDQVQEDDGIMINSGFLDGMNIHDATKKIMDYMEKEGYGKCHTVYHLRDWLISRQRYWGPPIPMIYCQNCAKAGRSWFNEDEAQNYQLKNESADKKMDHGSKLDQKSDKNMFGWYPVPDEDLPVILPRIDDYKPGSDGIAPLSKHKEFYETRCPGCGGKAVRETDVSDTFLDSSWYFLRYPSVNTSTDISWDPEITKKWLPVRMYTGGAEHSVLHLLYSRFVTMALKDFGYLDFEEPFAEFFAHGLVIKDGAKMSKSKGNVVNPDDYIKTFSADALRLYLMFMGPFSQGGDFRDTAMEGMSRWIGRVWRMAKKVISTELLVNSQKTEDNNNLRKQINKVIKKVGDDLEARRYNTAIAVMMEFTNWVSDQNITLTAGALKKFLLILAPFAPHISEELWQRVNGHEDEDYVAAKSIHTQGWPSYDPEDIVSESTTIAIQVNGKLRASVEMNIESAGNRVEVENLARSDLRVQKHLNGCTVRKIVFIPKKIINFVV